jgi:pyruvate/2-oxoglutarate dehydrogenase complex dihydrolipoamide acyltransferase (E2) component
MQSQYIIAVLIALLALSNAFHLQSSKFTSSIINKAKAVHMMSDQIFMPALSSTTKEAKVASWSKKVGDRISAGDVILAVESDKAAMDIESYEDGYLASILVNEGEFAGVGSPVAVIVKTVEELNKINGGGSKGSSSSGSNLSFFMTFGGDSKPSTKKSSAPLKKTGLSFIMTFDEPKSKASRASSASKTLLSMTFDEEVPARTSRASAPAAPARVGSFATF